MKKQISTIPLLILLLLLANVAKSQNFRFGMSFSPNVLWMANKTKNVTPDGVKFGYGYGITMERVFEQNYSIATGVFIDQFGGNIVVGKNTYKNPDGFDSIYNNIAYNYRNSYVTVPIALKLRTNEIGYFTYYGVFGLSNSILTSAKAKISNGPAYYNSDEFNFVNKNEDSEVLSDVTIEDNVRTFRFGLLLEAGTEYSISGNTALVLGIQYNNNLGGVLRSSDLSTSNSFVSLRVGVMF